MSQTKKNKKTRVKQCRSQKLPAQKAVDKLESQDELLRTLPSEKKVIRDFSRGESLLKRLIRKVKVKIPVKRKRTKHT